MADYRRVVWKSDVRSLVVSTIFGGTIGQGRVFIDDECS